MTDANTPVQTTIRAALVQADLVWADPVANREQLAQLMHAEPADLYILPETFTTGFLGDLGLEIESLEGPTLDWLRSQARARQAAICGSYVVSEQGDLFNRFVFVDEDGRLLGCYDKHHLFGPGGEGARYRAGSNPVVIDWRGWRIDLQVCYDLRFPVWCRNDRDYDLQIFVANWPRPRVAHWQALLRARAIENQAFVIGVNRVGTDGRDIPYSGCSSAWSASGEALIELGDHERVAAIDLDLDGLRKYRTDLPFLADADGFVRDAS
jgi:predicted amidohydrolase